MPRVALGQLRIDPTLPQFLPMRLRVVRPVPVHLLRPVLWLARPFVQRAGGKFLDRSRAQTALT
jgi:hypothetical protein